MRRAGPIKRGYTLDERDAINYWYKDLVGQLSLAPLTQGLVLRVGDCGQRRLAPADFMPEGYIEREDAFLAHVMHFLYATSGDSSAIDQGPQPRCHSSNASATSSATSSTCSQR